MKLAPVVALLPLLFATAAHAGQKAGEGGDSAARAIAMAQRAIAFRSVAGPGNQTPQLAQWLKEQLVAGGFAASEVSVTPVDDTAYLIARWPGTDPKAKPLVISGHIDVVEAKPADWERDPFTAVVENGYLYGRGATDMKLDAAIAIVTLIDMKKAGYRPRRDIVLQFSGDEETRMKTSALIADKLKNAELVINIDGGGGVLDEKIGKPLYMTWNGAEKTYADFELSLTDPGGHSSEPRPRNIIADMGASLAKIGAYRFTPELSDLTRAYFNAAARYEDAETGAAMKAFAANPKDEKAIATLRANYATIGKIGTTCIPTMVNGGHALNALPQRVTATINCRIFPGHKPADIMKELAGVAGDPKLVWKDVTEGSIPNDASPMRPDFTGAVTRALGKAYPGVPVFPSMSSGASDSMWYRSVGVPSYGASPVFIKESDSFSHGLNERTPIASVAPAIVYYRSLFTDLSK